MIAEFATEENGLEFMAYLMRQNKQGHKQIVFGWISISNDVEYYFNDVIDADLRDKVANYLSENN